MDSKELENLGRLCRQIITECDKELQEEYIEMFKGMCCSHAPLTERVNEILDIVYIRNRDKAIAEGWMKIICPGKGGDIDKYPCALGALGKKCRVHDSLNAGTGVMKDKSKSGESSDEGIRSIEAT